MDEDEKQASYRDFADSVNMSPAELEGWLDTEQSQSVGDTGGKGESTGHKSGRRIVELKRTAKSD